MSYPPARQRKHPALSPSEARSQHLQPYQFQPGQSGNSSGMSNGQRALYLEARELAHQLGPGAIRRLGELAGLTPGGEWVPLEELNIDPRVILLAATALAERVYGKPKEFSSAQVLGEKESEISPEERRRRAVEEINQAFQERSSGE
jgi:hypothetical protein